MLTIRPAAPDDLDTIIRFTRELAEYEKMLDEVTLDPSRLHEELFGVTPHAWALIALWDNQPAGLAVCCHTFSTFLGKHGIYIEDIYVAPEFRGNKIGKTLVQHIAKRAVESGCERVDWQVLDWNKPSIDFYEQLGAYDRKHWLNYRLDGNALAALAEQA